MWYEIPPRVKVRTVPWVVLLVVLLGAAHGLPEQPSTARLRSPRATTRVNAARHAGRSAPVAGIPARALAAYRAACRPGEIWRTRDGGRRYACWAVLGGVGWVESKHGSSHAPGVHSGVNRFGCCAGPMQFNLHDGPPSTWDRWGHGSVYDLEDATRAAAAKLRGDGAARRLDVAVHAYNHSWVYVAQVLALARRYQH